MKKFRRRLVWVVLWMAVIFLFSAQTSQRSKELSGAVMEQLTIQQTDNTRPSAKEEPERQLDRDLLNAVIRKAAHLGEYAVLSVLVAYAIWDLNLPKKAKWILPAAVSSLYAVTDEVHQYFVPGRSCRLVDIGVDTCGAILGICFVAVLAWVWKKIGKRKTSVTVK